MSCFKSDYCYFHNTPDRFDPDLPLLKSKAHGGTMMMWKQEFDPYVKVHPPCSPSTLAIFFKPPGILPSVHVTVYLPTQGLEQSFLEELTNLAILTRELKQKYINVPLFIRGDFNVNDKNTTRRNLLDAFMNEEHFTEIATSHPTYHHFVGNGKSDSFLDKILLSTVPKALEVIETVICGRSDPLVASHHDIVMSNCSVGTELSSPIKPPISVAPSISNSRCKVLWSDSGIESYQKLLAPHLNRLQQLWLSSPPSKNCMSLLLSATNNLLSSCAEASNTVIPLLPKEKLKVCKTPRSVLKSAKRLKKKYSELKNLKRRFPANNQVVLDAESHFKVSRHTHRKLVRSVLSKQSIDRDTRLLNDPKKTFAQIRRSKAANNASINTLYVGDKAYLGDDVSTGFFDAISNLKTKDKTKILDSSFHRDFTDDYRHIIELCRSGRPVKNVSEVEALSLLQRMKPNVIDFFSITPNHYLYAGPQGWKHFSLLLNGLLYDVRNVAIDEVNTAYACILFKGHNKDKTLSNSYRTISTCPVVAKALDLYIRDIHLTNWNLRQMST